METKNEIEKEIYTSPKLTIITFNCKDIITTSNTEDDDEDIPETNNDSNYDKGAWA